MWESGGQYGMSVLRRYELGAADGGRGGGVAAGAVRRGNLPGGREHLQLTWRERVALRWDAATLQIAEKVPFNREGWGICASRG